MQKKKNSRERERRREICSRCKEEEERERRGKREQVFSERELNENNEKERVITFALILRLLGKGFSLAAVESFYLSTRQLLDLGVVGGPGSTSSNGYEH